MALAVIVLGFVSVVVASLREVAIVLFKGDCSQHIPSRGTAHDNREQLCRVRQMRIYLVRIPRRKGHSIQSIVRPGSVISRRSPASTVRLELAQTGGISSCQATRIEQPAESGSSSPPFCFGATSEGHTPLGTMQLTWAEDRALLARLQQSFHISHN